ncbi:hypothetical protein CQ018_03190 [Arthrobacter sp. MYb227]|nr:hypothetical protein CQ018_03190 [Arthrobacter sp. MYb227]
MGDLRETLNALGGHERRDNGEHRASLNVSTPRRSSGPIRLPQRESGRELGERFQGAPGG